MTGNTHKIIRNDPKCKDNSSVINVTLILQTKPLQNTGYLYSLWIGDFMYHVHELVQVFFANGKKKSDKGSQQQSIEIISHNERLYLSDPLETIWRTPDQAWKRTPLASADALHLYQTREKWNKRSNRGFAHSSQGCAWSNNKTNICFQQANQISNRVGSKKKTPTEYPL
jgi:hypothetical protein